MTVRTCLNTKFKNYMHIKSEIISGIKVSFNPIVNKHNLAEPS